MTGWATLHGYPTSGILANARGVLFSEESQKATQFIQLANRVDTPLLFLHNTTGYMVGKEYEEGGMIKHGSMMINAVSNSTVPHISLLIGASYGAGQLRHVRSGLRPAVPVRLAERQVRGDGPGTAGRRDVDRAAGRAAEGVDVDEDADAAMRADDRGADRGGVAANVPVGHACYDDGVIDPRDTRTVLGIALSAIHSARSRGREASECSAHDNTCFIDPARSSRRQQRHPADPLEFWSPTAARSPAGCSRTCRDLGITHRRRVTPIPTTRHHMSPRPISRCTSGPRSQRPT